MRRVLAGLGALAVAAMFGVTLLHGVPATITDAHEKFVVISTVVALPPRPAPTVTQGATPPEPSIPRATPLVRATHTETKDPPISR